MQEKGEEEKYVTMASAHRILKNSGFSTHRRICIYIYMPHRILKNSGFSRQRRFVLVDTQCLCMIVLESVHCEYYSHIKLK